MMSTLRNNRDFWAGAMLIVIGAAAMFVSQDYRFGSALRMGPGFFPTILSGILIVFGVCIMAVGLRSGEKIEGFVSLRVLLMLPLALVLFGVLMDQAGFVPALVVLVFMSAAAGKEFKWGEVLLLTVALTLASTALFVWGLGLPYPMIKGF